MASFNIGQLGGRIYVIENHEDVGTYWNWTSEFFYALNLGLVLLDFERP